MKVIICPAALPTIMNIMTVRQTVVAKECQWLLCVLFIKLQK